MVDNINKDQTANSIKASAEKNFQSEIKQIFMTGLNTLLEKEKMLFSKIWLDSLPHNSEF